MVNFSSEAGGVSLWNLFDCYTSVGKAMKAETYFAESTFSDGTLESIVADHFELGGSKLLAKLLISGSQGSLLVDGGAAALATILVSSASAGLTHG